MLTIPGPPSRHRTGMSRRHWLRIGGLAMGGLALPDILRAEANSGQGNKAKGIIMGERRCTADEAFTILSKLSQDTNRKLRDVAVALVDSAQQPRPS